MSGIPAASAVADALAKAKALALERARFALSQHKQPAEPGAPATVAAVPPAAPAPAAAIPSPALVTAALAAARAAAAAQQQQQMQYQQHYQQSLAMEAQRRTGPVLLDAQGRIVDAAGNVLSVPKFVPQLIANRRALEDGQDREDVKRAKVKEEPEVKVNPYFDPSLKAADRSLRKQRGLKFHDKGKFEQQAHRIRAKAQLERLQHEIADAAKKSGLEATRTAASAAVVADPVAEEVPDVEWWDAPLLPGNSYDLPAVDGNDPKAKFPMITNLVEHPVEINPPNEPAVAPVVPVMLTKKERKKLRAQRRRAAEKELQEKIQMGLAPAPETKVKLSNMMRVYGQEAVQDPTKIEAEVRAQMEKRRKEHEQANLARQLTPEERRAKKLKKLTEDTSLEARVCVFRVNDLRHPQRKFKVDMNAQELQMTGITVLSDDFSIVVVEGGPKAMKKFKRLMLQRIKWDDDNDDDDGAAGGTAPRRNECALVWEGSVKERSFRDWRFKLCPTVELAREQLRKHRVEHYYDIAANYSSALADS